MTSLVGVVQATASSGESAFTGPHGEPPYKVDAWEPGASGGREGGRQIRVERSIAAEAWALMEGGQEAQRAGRLTGPAGRVPGPREKETRTPG
jgi:hypothetical protein